MIEFEIKPLKGGVRSARYSVLHKGEMLVKSTADPEHESARVWLELHPKDKSKMATWVMAGAERGVRGELGKVAKMACRDSDKRGLKLIKWNPDDGNHD